MPDHLHVLVTGLVEQADAWLAMVAFKQQSGQWFWATGTDCRWQKTFVPRSLLPDRSLDAVAGYIMNNPVRAGLAMHWEEYPFSGRIEREHWRYRV